MSLNKYLETIPLNELIKYATDRILLIKKSENFIHRLEFPVEQIDPLDWLASQHESDKIYWQSNFETMEIAGCGRVESFNADTIEKTYTNIEEIEAIISGRNSSDHIRIWGGIRFQHNYHNYKFDNEWKNFGVSWFVLPRFELIKNQEKCLFAINLRNDELENDSRNKIYSELSKLVFSVSDNIHSEFEYTGVRNDFPSKDKWHKNVKSALFEFETGKTDKIVLARKSALLFKNEINSWMLLKKLRSRSINCYLFGFQPKGDSIFFGATPEKLYKIDNELFTTEAVAGTRPRGDSIEEDQSLANELISSEKDRREHQIVINAIKKALSQLELKGEIDQSISIRKLARVQHLVIAIKAKLSRKISNLDLLRNLHPTPAVGGNPSKRAMELIETLEQFDRGWYSGPVGYIGKNQSEFAVAIRSALTLENKIYLYSGAGIVEGSNPDKEWDEIESKIQTIIHALGND